MSPVRKHPVPDLRADGKTLLLHRDKGTTTCFVFESFAFTGNARSSTEGEVCWIPDSALMTLALPASDPIFLPWIYEGTRFFSAKFSNGLRNVTFYP